MSLSLCHDTTSPHQLAQLGVTTGGFHSLLLHSGCRQQPGVSTSDCPHLASSTPPEHAVPRYKVPLYQPLGYTVTTLYLDSGLILVRDHSYIICLLPSRSVSHYALQQIDP